MRSSQTMALLLVAILPIVACAQQDEEARFAADTFEGLAMRSLGPALMSGRIADIAIHPDRQSTWYVGVGSGNVWRTQNAGTTWEPIFDDQGSYSIGCITIDPNRHDTIWVGTGENVSGRHVGYGDGVYRSLDGGDNWERMGLEDSEHIGMIAIDPRDSNAVYVAAQGPLWSPGGDRGLYKSIDGGASFERILGAGDYTGVSEVFLDPRDPDVLYAVTHQRYRTVAALVDGGPESGIHKSTDAGMTWRRLEKGLPEEDMGKIGFAISPQQPDVLYAGIELGDRKGGVWRSEDGGETWEKRSDYVAGGTGPHYYQELFASPHAFDRIYHMDVRLGVSNDGGTTFTKVPHEHKHSDNHALAFDPDDPNYLLSGVDGGLYESWDLGENWKFIANLPVTQFYKVAVDNDLPFYNVYGGTQDNNTQGGPSRTDSTVGIRNADWFITLFGDGHQPATDPTNPDIVYSHWQQGNLVRFDRKTGEIVYIQPQPAADEPWDRFNWDAPILVSPHDPATLFHASQRVWRSDDRGDSWTPISGDLSRARDRLALPMMGRVHSIDAAWDVYAMSKYGTITSLTQSPLDEQLIYAGTDDGLIQVTENGGESWRRIDALPGVPGDFFVNDIKADLYDADTVYVVVDDHKTGNFSPYVLMSNNRGATWRSIAGDLPDRHLVWRIVQDHENPQLLFAGTEFGVFFTVDRGSRWVKLSGGVPNIPFRDLAIQRRENDLVGATFGRGFYVLDDYTALRQVSDEMLEQETLMFPIRAAQWYIERRTLGRGNKGAQGAAYFTTPNPPFGAVVTYYLRDELKTAQARRRDREKEIEENGGDTPTPGWDTLRREELEEEPAMILIVRNPAGDIVRRLEGPVEAGFHRVAWDLRYPPQDPWEPESGEPPWMEPAGVLAAPGTYTVELASRIDGKLTDLGQKQSFEVVRMREPTLPGASPTEMVAFARRVDALARAADGAVAAADEGLRQLGAIRQALMRSTAPPALDEQTRALERELHGLKERVAGNERRARFNDPGPVSIQRRLEVASIGKRYSTYGPTATQTQSVAIATSQLESVQQQLDRVIEVRLPALGQKLDEAGVPWTPGRGVPMGN